MLRLAGLTLFCCAVWPPAPLGAQGIEQPLYSFNGGGGDNPFASVIQGTDGALYGMTPEGGADGEGAVFRIGTNGAGYRTLYSFDFRGLGGDGALPLAGLVQVTGGMLYGMTASGGTNGAGTIFKIGTNGTGHSPLYSFGAYSGDAVHPQASLIQGIDGALYGTTDAGGPYNGGTVFTIGTNGTAYSVLYSFKGTNGGDGSACDAGLVQGKDGALYGTTLFGGISNAGTIFKIGTNGSGYSVLHQFGTTLDDGTNTQAGLIQGSDGALYGTTKAGGADGEGTVFKIGTDGSGYSVLYNFGATSGDGLGPGGSLVQGSDGALYGTTVGGGTNNMGTVFTIRADGTGYIPLYSFTGTNGDGRLPGVGLVQGSDGVLYGTTVVGGTYNGGTLFRFVVPPQIVTQPQNVVAPAGSLAWLRVVALGVPAPVYQWQFNGTNLTDNGRITGSQSNTLAIANVQLADAGSYSVIMTNIVGSTNSQPATLSLGNAASPVFQSATLAASNGAINITWSATPGGTYQVQYTTNLGQANWLNLDGPIAATNTTAAASDLTTDQQRFYRVVLLQ